MLTIMDYFLVKKSKRDGICGVGTCGQGIKGKKDSQKFKKTAQEETLGYFIRCFLNQRRTTIIDNALDTG